MAMKLKLLILFCLWIPTQFSLADDDFLTADQAFKLKSTIKDSKTLILQWIIADGHYLYKKRFKFSLKDSKNIKLGKFELPKAKEKQDPNFGKMYVYYGGMTVEIPLIRMKKETEGILLAVKYQGCSEKGLCYQPVTKKIDLLLPPIEKVSIGGKPSKASPGVLLSEQDQIAASCLFRRW